MGRRRSANQKANTSQMPSELFHIFSPRERANLVTCPLSVSRLPRLDRVARDDDGRATMSSVSKARLAVDCWFAAQRTTEIRRQDTTMPLNPIHQLISSTIRSSDGSYLIVLQHSLHQRNVMAKETADEQIYRRAGVRTPAQNAQRDFLGNVWLQYLANEFQKTAKGLVWVETTGAIPMDASRHDVTVLNAAANPYGWDEKESDETLTLENLQVLADAIQNHVDNQKRPIVVESLTPIIMRHGLAQTLAFLRQLVKFNTPILAPILIETLSPAQHRALEDIAQAVLYLQGGDMTMIRQGVRERGNILREIVPFQVRTNDVNGAVSIEILEQGAKTDDEPLLSTFVTEDVKYDEQTPRLPGKVKLELEDDNAPPSKDEVHRPLIYVQDNDPEFDDMDEEDPDDDLDI